MSPKITTLAVDTTCSILRLTSNVMCFHSRGRAEFRRRRRKSLPPPPAEFWSGRQPDLVRASRKSGGGAAEGSSHIWCELNNAFSVDFTKSCSVSDHDNKPLYCSVCCDVVINVMMQMSRMEILYGASLLWIKVCSLVVHESWRNSLYLLSFLCYSPEMSGILLKIREVSGKSCLKLFIVSCIFASMQVFSRSLFCVKYDIYGFGSSTAAFLSTALKVTLVQA